MAKTFPYLEVSGTHRDVGAAIGNRFKDNIQAEIAWCRKYIPEYQDYLNKVRALYEITKKTFPNLIREADAIAVASQVDRMEYFFMNSSEVYDLSEVLDRDKWVNPGHCTVAVSFGQDGAVVGHNEDWAIPALKNLYLLKASINGITFFGLQYNTSVPGIVATMNNHGLVQCINYLWHTKEEGNPHQMRKIGIPKNFVARAVLECKTIDEAEKLIRETEHASGYGHVIIRGGEVLCLEPSGGTIGVLRKTTEVFVHTSHAVTPEIDKLKHFRDKHSEPRYRRASELIRPGMTKGEMVELLSDTSDPESPICRPRETIASMIAIPQKKEVWICYGHPCAGEFVKYEL